MTGAERSVGDIYPALTYDDAPAAIDWLCAAFGFRKRLVVPGRTEESNTLNCPERRRHHGLVAKERDGTCQS